MKGMMKVIIFIICLLSIGFISPKTTIEINNPTSFSIELLLKCNWDGREWKHLKTYNLKRKSKIVVYIPNASKCQLWPKI
jgi:hypothetical protein